ncbi:MAG: branched-chain amino acid ABC transporter permease, partial [Burkholderiales bacterium]
MIVVAALLVAPFVLSSFHTTLLVYIGLASIVALGLVLMTGVGGLTSFGQAAFVGIGAYTTAYLTTAQGVSPWLALFVGLAITAAVALFLGAITMRLSGHYLPLGTIAWSISLFYVFANLEGLGGYNGLAGVPPLSIGGVELVKERQFYYVVWPAVGLAMVTIHNLLDSRPGRAIRSLRGGVVMAEAFGINTALVKMAIFLYAALLAALSGWLFAHFLRFVNPTPFGIGASIEYLFMAVIGGASTIWGAIVGAGILTIVKEWLQDWLPKLIGRTGQFEIIVFGILMIFLLQHARQGVVPLVARRYLKPRQ